MQMSAVYATATAVVHRERVPERAVRLFLVRMSVRLTLQVECRWTI